MTNTVIFGNSGSGKSTLAARISKEEGASHLDLDTIAWEPVSPPVRRSIEESRKTIIAFINIYSDWVIEGCYADLLEIALPFASKIIYLSLPIEACISNAKSRPWEPHKYVSKEAQDANLNMLIDWIREYKNRQDTFSQAAHKQLFEGFNGEKIRYFSNEEHL